MNRNRVVYIAHPVGGDVENNVKKIEAIISDILLTEDNVLPVAPYLVYLRVLNDDIPNERKLGMDACISFLKFAKATEMWLYGDKCSTGMKHEIVYAEHLGMRIIPKTEKIANHYKNTRKRWKL